MLPYGDVWRASRRMFTKHFNPSNPSINQPRQIIYVRRFLGQLLQKPSYFLQHARTYVPSPLTTFLVTDKHLSLIGSTSISMTYSINIRLYNDPYIKIAEDAVRAVVELLIPGALLVDSGYYSYLEVCPRMVPRCQIPE